MIDLTEKDIQDSILAYLELKEIYCWRNNTGAYKTASGHFVRYGYKGSADIIGIMPDGRFLAIEVKRRKGKTTYHQELFLTNIEANGGVAIVARSLEDIIQIL